MNFNFKKEQLAQLIPRNKEIDEWYDLLVAVLPRYNITTKIRAASFISQCAHESYDFTRLEENLNYSKRALETVFSRYFGAPPKRNAAEYARKPEKIANYVYMDEYRTYKLGNVNPGDGWRFRGKGLKQVTGRSNVTRFAHSIGITADEASEYLLTKQGALHSACWFWDSRNLNKVADTGDVVKLSKIINGGTNGLDDRVRRFDDAMSILSESNTPEMPETFMEEVETELEYDDFGILQKGSTGHGVREVQRKLNLAIDGVFGPNTEKALKAWQKQHGLVADGIAGPNTLDRMLG